METQGESESEPDVPQVPHDMGQIPHDMERILHDMQRISHHMRQIPPPGAKALAIFRKPSGLIRAESWALFRTLKYIRGRK